MASHIPPPPPPPPAPPMNGTGRLVWVPGVAGRRKRQVESLIITVCQPWDHPSRHIWGYQTYPRATGREVTSTEMPAWLAPPKTPTNHSRHRVAALPKGDLCWKGGCRFSTNITVGRTVAHFCAWRKWLHCRREGAADGGSCSSRFTTSSVIAQIHTKKARRLEGEEHQERPRCTWRGEGCWKSNLWSRMILVALSFGQVG